MCRPSSGCRLMTDATSDEVARPLARIRHETFTLMI